MPMMERRFDKKRHIPCLAKCLVGGRYLINVSDTRPWREKQTRYKIEVGRDIQFLLLKPKALLVGTPRNELEGASRFQYHFRILTGSFLVPGRLSLSPQM